MIMYKCMGRWILRRSLILALNQQNYKDLYWGLERMIPDVSDQYNDLKVGDSDYLKINVRGMHCFQMDLVFGLVGSEKRLGILDIGDSCGNHIQYVKKWFPEKDVWSISINPDIRACNKISDKGMSAVCAKAEDIHRNGKFDLVFMFETLEHISDPIGVLKSLSKMNIGKMVITVPYVRRSRVHLKNWRQKGIEDIHIFELNPVDWKALFDYCGWSVKKEKIYYQYPPFLPFNYLLKWLWRWVDYEGFYGVVLEKEGVKGLKPDRIVIDEFSRREGKGND